MITITTTIKRIGYVGDTIRSFEFSAVVTHSDYPGVSTGFGGEPLVDLPRGSDLYNYIQSTYENDPHFVQHIKNVLEFEYIRANLTYEEVVD